MNQPTLSKQQILEILKTLSAMESVLMAIGKSNQVPDYLFEQISNHVETLEKEILNEPTHNDQLPTHRSMATHLRTPEKQPGAYQHADWC